MKVGISDLKDTDNGISDALQPDPQIKRGWVFFTISLALLLITIDSTIVATALHTLQSELHTSVSWVGWTLTAYSFGFVLMLPLSAKLSVNFGHRRVFMGSILVFAIASLLCGLSTNIYMLIVMRIFQAIGGAGITPSATGLIVDYFKESRAQYLGLFGSMFSIGAMIGPIFGGLFVTYWSWPWIFYVNIPLCLAILLLALRLIPKDPVNKSVRERMDFAGLAYLATAILSGMYAATYLSEHENALLSPVFLVAAGIAILTFTVLFYHLKKVESPFIQPRFIFGKGFGAVNLVNVIYSGMVIGATSLIPLYAVSRYGLSDINSGTLLVANGIASVVLSTIMSIYIRKTGYRMPLYIGGIILAVGIALLALKPQFGTSAFIWLMGSTFLLGVGFGVMSPAGRNAGIQLAPEQSANLAAVRSLGMQLGQITAIAVATAIITGSQDANFAQSMVYIGLAILLVITLPIISKVPENKGAW